MKKVKNIVCWALAIFFATSVPMFFPSISNVFAILLIALIIPIPQWQEKISGFVKGKLKIVIAVVLALLMISTAPETDVDTEQSANPTLATESLDNVGNASADVTTEATEPSEESAPIVTEPVATEEDAPAEEETAEVTTEPTTVPTEAPTTEPVTEATTQPTVAPATEPETEATTEPTTAPTTEPPHTHSFSAATCVEASACECGEKVGEPKGHSWQDATCTIPETCKVCGVTNGTATGHNYSDGSCTACGASDPNFVRETLVWIPTKGGEKYHSRSSCSGMEDPIQVTQSEAEELGFERCKRCH